MPLAKKMCSLPPLLEMLWQHRQAMEVLQFLGILRLLLGILRLILEIPALILGMLMRLMIPLEGKQAM